MMNIKKGTSDISSPSYDTMSSFVTDHFIFCSEQEAEHRQRTFDVHQLEATEETKDLPPSKRIIDPHRAVKKFYRSGTQDLHKAVGFRSLEQLEATLRYLCYNVWSEMSSPFVGASSHPSDIQGIKYTFIMDRIQAVRQELVICKWSSKYSDYARLKRIFLLMVNFYVQSMHVVCAAPKSDPLSWYDQHLHEQALSSCLCTASELFKIHKDVDALAMFSSISAMLVAAKSLREVFREIVSTAAKTAVSSSSLSSPSSTSTSTSISMSSILCQQVSMQLSKGLPTPGLTAALRNLEDFAATSATTNTTAASTDTAISPTGLACSYSERSSSSRRRTSSLFVPVEEVVITGLGCLRRGNPAGAVRSFARLAAVLNANKRRNIGKDVDKETTASRAETEARNAVLLIAVVFLSMLPELRLWRLLMADAAANKNEAVTLESLARRLWFSEPGDAAYLCQLLNLQQQPQQQQLQSVTSTSSLSSTSAVAASTAGTAAGTIIVPDIDIPRVVTLVVLKAAAAVSSSFSSSSSTINPATTHAARPPSSTTTGGTTGVYVHKSGAGDSAGRPSKSKTAADLYNEVTLALRLRCALMIGHSSSSSTSAAYVHHRISVVDKSSKSSSNDKIIDREATAEIVPPDDWSTCEQYQYQYQNIAAKTSNSDCATDTVSVDTVTEANKSMAAALASGGVKTVNNALAAATSVSIIVDYVRCYTADDWFRI